MGSLISKDTNKQQEGSFGKITPKKSILTPNTQILEIDPRSPSANISRTPIEVSGTPLRDDFGVHDTFNINSPGVINKILLDPRSPAVEFIRTPIVAQEKKPNILRNKNLDNVLFNDTPKQRKPKLLDSTPINATSKNLSKRKSFAGYLETNLDFVETNLDEVVLRKSLSNLCTKSDYTPIKSLVNTIEKEVNIKDGDLNTYNSCESGSENYEEKSHLNSINTRTEGTIEVHNIIDDIIDDVFDIEDIKMDIIPRIVALSPKPRNIIKSFDKKINDLICKESYLESNNPAYTVNEEILSAEFKEHESINEKGNIVLENFEDILDCSINNTDKLEDTLVSEEKIVVKPLINKLTVKDIVIKTTGKQEKYRCENEIRAVKIAKDIKDPNNQNTIRLKHNIIKRIPLTDRNSSNKIHAIPKLRVHDKPRKTQYSVSKIPQFKGKRFAKVPSVQCENTPPTKNASVWDNEETLVI